MPFSVSKAKDKVIPIGMHRLRKDAKHSGDISRYLPATYGQVSLQKENLFCAKLPLD